MKTPEELQARIDQLRKELVDIVENRSFKMDSGVQVELRKSEIFVCASQLAEISTRRIERLTNRLVCLTYVLAALTLGLFVIELAHYYGH